MNTQALINKDNEIKEDEKEYDDSSKVISLYGDQMNQDSSIHKSRLHFESQQKLDKLLLEEGTDSSLSPDQVSVKQFNDEEFNNLTNDFSLNQRRQSIKDRKRKSNSLFNNNKFTMAVKIDNEKKNK